MNNLIVQKLTLNDLLLIEPKIFADDRGFFLESWNYQKYSEKGIPYQFVQDNMSFSKQGVLRGLHFQLHKPQGKLVSVLQGEILDVVVDIRPDSSTFSKWESVILSESNKKQLFLPAGFAHGFVVLSETALVYYKCTEIYFPEHEKTIIWNDSFLNIDWQFTGQKIISEKDQKGLKFEELKKIQIS